ncbi:MAG: hypothetical protein MHMPM18_000093 [Marteilia pararefringens]
MGHHYRRPVKCSSYLTSKAPQSNGELQRRLDELFDFQLLPEAKRKLAVTPLSQRNLPKGFFEAPHIHNEVKNNQLGNGGREMVEQLIPFEQHRKLEEEGDKLRNSCSLISIDSLGNTENIRNFEEILPSSDCNPFSYELDEILECEEI